MAKHTVAYYEKRKLNYTMEDLTEAEQERLLYESLDMDDRLEDAIHAVYQINEGWNLNVSSSDKYSKMYNDLLAIYKQKGKLTEEDAYKYCRI